jgi:sirohydrochlorin ferrochelatase
MNVENSAHRPAALLIAHGSRRQEANLDLVGLAESLRARAAYRIVEVAYLEIATPTIPEAAQACVAQGATTVLMLPYFLSEGNHVALDLERYRTELQSQHPGVSFILCKPLSPHPLLVDVVVSRLVEAEDAQNAKPAASRQRSKP